jgi:hypothetical protein
MDPPKNFKTLTKYLFFIVVGPCKNYKLTPKTEAEGRVKGSNAPLTSLRFLPSIFFPLPSVFLFQLFRIRD